VNFEHKGLDSRSWIDLFSVINRINKRLDVNCIASTHSGETDAWGFALFKKLYWSWTSVHLYFRARVWTWSRKCCVDYC